jgi:eukaryotic-like serine/threonine-protein kinase
VGFVVLGPKRSEESYTKEDRRLLAGIAAQMGLALDLSRLRRQAAATPRGLVAADAPTLGTPSGVDVGVTIDGKYRIDALVGRGGMGAVYRARDTGLERDVAVKVVRGDLVASPEARERFKREAQLAARLHHPSIVTVFDYGTLPDGSAYLVMEYVRGEDLRARLMRGTLDWKDAVRLLAAVADGVDAAHREQILHRDLKPENVLLPESGGPPKVLDFGVAKMMASGDSRGTVTSGATIVGTPAYMAPEQLRGEAVDRRTDVYSLAVMAYEMLTGRLPFGAGTFVEVAVRQQADEPPLDAASLPDRMAGVLRRALSFQPTRRPETAMAFAAELRQALGER